MSGGASRRDGGSRQRWLMAGSSASAWTRYRRSWCLTRLPRGDPRRGCCRRSWLRLRRCCSPELFWPVAAISRRRHHVQLPVTGLALRGPSGFPYRRRGPRNHDGGVAAVVDCRNQGSGQSGAVSRSCFAGDVHAFRHCLRRGRGGDALGRVGRVHEPPAARGPYLDRGPRFSQRWSCCISQRFIT